MFSWDDLQNMHVIRKFETVLGQWFGVDLFYVDQFGKVRNMENRRENPRRHLYAGAILGHPKSFEAVEECANQAVNQFKGSKDRNIMWVGPFNVRAMATRLEFEGNFMGCIIALGYYSEFKVDQERAKTIALMNECGFSTFDVENAVGRLRVIKAEEMSYFREILDLVGDEVTTLYQEIGRRDAKISELNSELGSRYRYDNMIGKSKPMQELYGLLDKLRSSESTVLVQGENGTGKELIARAIHFNSPRKDKGFVTVNCSAFNENLLDSELFGHVKGAFTGAIGGRKGLFESADKGTLFLDEIGDTSPTMQVKLLRVLQEGTFIPVGSTESRKVDVRIIAATNKDLKKMIEDGTFREDLYYRINVINIYVPALRDRTEDVPLLVEHFMNKACTEKNLPVKQLAKKTFEKILDYVWPGNIRELENEIERLVVLAGDDVKVAPELLSSRIRDYAEKKISQQGARLHGKLKDALEDLEKQMIYEGLIRTKWNKSRLAKELGISRAGLIMKVEKYGLDKRNAPRVMRG